MSERRSRATYANVTATLALIVALGGTSYAALTITGEDVRDGSLTGADLKDGSVGPADLAASQRKAGTAKKKKAKPGPRGPAGPQGPVGSQGQQGPAGTAPACQGNGSGDTMVQAGSVCVDRYEVSVWSSPTGGIQYGGAMDDYPCDNNGQDCTNIYARSVAGVMPSRFITWFQAQQALANSGKRLATNAEWQQAVAGTPDPGATPGAEDCNTNSAGPVVTGSRDNCISNHGANDMVGNVQEWVADWVPDSTDCPDWAAFSDDEMCLSGAATMTTGPGALARGGRFDDGADAGPFAVTGQEQPQFSSAIGLRGAR